MSGAFRSKYRELTQDEKDKLLRIKTAASNLLVAIDTAYGVPDDLVGNLEAHPQHNTREHALAKLKLEESVMWGVKGLTG